MIDSNFKSVKIGDQEWMTENLNVTNFRNGEQIPKAKTEEEWLKFGIDGKPAWCNLIWSDDENDNNKKFGKFYNWYAVNDPRGLAPKGWHVPTDSEWKQLTDSGGEDIAVKKMKNTTGWETYGSQYNGTNESGFSALPRGGRNSEGVYVSINEESYWWSSTESEQMNYGPACYGVNPWTRKIIFSHPVLYRKCSENKGFGLSVRCLRDF